MAIKKTKKKARKKKKAKVKALDVNGWHTTDAVEIERRRLRGQTEKFYIENTTPAYPYFSTFLLKTRLNQHYIVEIRSLSELINSCDCLDYCTNQLGTCKHIEHLLFSLRKKGAKLFKQAQLAGNPRIEIFFEVCTAVIKIQWPKKVNAMLHQTIGPFFSSEGVLIGDPVTVYPALLNMLTKRQRAGKSSLRLSRHIAHFMDYQQRIQQKALAKAAFLNDIAKEKQLVGLLKQPLYPYQYEGMLHLVFNERALLADEMGLGKTVQAIAACALLQRFNKISRVLIVATASLKTEWEEQINKFTHLTKLIIQGSRPNRLQHYQSPAFFYLTHYEQIVIDGPEIQRLLSPDVIILDEAQRIKNWQTKTANAIKQLKSRYAFVLTGTPLENRIDDIYSIVQFLDPHLFGPLFRFNRTFYALDEKGKPTGYKNLDLLHYQLRPIMLRRSRNEVEGQLSKLTIKDYFIKMDSEQRSRYEVYQASVARLLAQAKHRPLRKEEFEKLQKCLACMRMLCDTPFILDPECRISPKIQALATCLKELLLDQSTKIIIFSEWERMLQLVREWVQKQSIEAVWHTGSVSQHQRRAAINRFKENPHCRLFLSTDTGSLGLNLQMANVVINLDLPWNPAKLAQRIARAWRKHQHRPVQVINLICEESIEQRMLALLAQKKDLAHSIVDGKSDIKEMKLPSGRAALIARMESLIGPCDATTLIQPVAVAKVAKVTKKEKTYPYVKWFAPNLDRIGLLQMYHHKKNESNEGKQQRTLFAVMDQWSKETSNEMHQALAHENIALEIVDYPTFEVIQRLAKAGLLSLHSPTEVLHTSAQFTHLKQSLQEKRSRYAKKHLEQALYKQRMAQVLMEGDFYAEALVPLREAFYATLYAFIGLIEKDTPLVEKIPSQAYFQEKLIQQQGLPPKALMLLNQFNEPNNAINANQVRNLLAMQQEIYTYVCEVATERDEDNSHRQGKASADFCLE